MAVTLSGSLTGIVNDIRSRSFRYVLRDGVCRKLVTPLGENATGYAYTEPTLDPTQVTGTATTEGTDITEFVSITSDTKTYTATEWAVPTFLTYDDIEDASESMRDFVASAHAMQHADQIEQRILAVNASFTTNTVTATSGLTWAAINAGKTLLAGPYKNAPKPYSMVCSDNAWYWFEAGIVGNANYAPTPLSDKILSDNILGTVAGVNIYRTYAIAASATQSAMMFAKPAIGLFVPRNFLYKTQEDISKRGYELISTLRSGARVRVETYGVNLTVKGSDPS